MLAGTAGSQFNNRLKPYSSFQLSPGKENKPQKKAEAHYHFQNLFLFYFFCLHQIEQTYIGTCKVNTLWCLFITIQIQLDKDWISIFFLLQTWKYSQIFTKKIVINNVHHSNVTIAGDWLCLCGKTRNVCVAEIELIKSTARKRGTEEENHLKTIRNRNSVNGNPKRIWL